MNEYWLLDQATADALRAAINSGQRPTNAEAAEMQAAIDAPQSRIMQVAGKTAQISVKGVLTEAPNWFARWMGMGNTTYGEIIGALAEADANPEVREAVMEIRSGGGQASDMLFDTLAAIESFGKPIVARIRGVGASAAYALASQADSVEATNKATRVGSIGVVVQFSTSDNVVTITSTKAPNKAPDVKTEAGQAVVRAELDALHSIFVDAIAKGRSTTVDKVNAEFGQGSVLLADEALKMGMIDSIVGAIPQTTTTKTTAAKSEAQKTTMTLAELKANEPEAYQAAVSVGITQERKRASDHIKLGQQSGAIDVAVKAISEGTPLADTSADYMAAQMKKLETSTRQTETDAANAAIDAANPAAPSASDKDDEDKLLEAFEANRNASHFAD